MTENKKTDREKLIELMREAYHFANNKCNNTVACMVCDNRKYEFNCHEVDKADYLLSHGVTFEKQGEWKKQWHDNNLIGHEYEECPICGCMISDTEKFWDCNYCPNCGAKMKGETK